MSTSAPRAMFRRNVPAEGENGVFSQSWFPVALASEVAPGKILGTAFLDGKVIVYRTADGSPRVTTAYCPHLGADLSIGKLIGEHVQCAFHHWEYDPTGQCVKTGIGDPAPKLARLFVFPSAERFGMIWAFNGETPLFDLPTLPYPDDQLLTSCYKMDGPLLSDPWVFAANTPDMQHLKVVHKMQFGVDDPHDLVRWNQFGMEFDYMAVHQGGVPMQNLAGIRGTSMFYRWGQYGPYWRAGITGFGLPKPGTQQVYSFQAVLKGPGAEAYLQDVIDVSRRTVGEDRDILNTIHYRQGLLTGSDKTLARFLTYLREYPRAHPSADLIN